MLVDLYLLRWREWHPVRLEHLRRRVVIILNLLIRMAVTTFLLLQLLKLVLHTDL